MKHGTLVSIIALILVAGGLTYAADPWNAPDYRNRLAITLPVSAGPIQVGVIFTGKDFFRWTGVPRPSVRAMMLGSPEGRIPLQVDERDGTGKIVSEGNGRLDDDDQVLFIATLGPTPRKLHLYYNGPEASMLPPRTEIAVAPGNPITLQSGELTIAVRGGGLDDPTKNVRENHGRGSIVNCTWQGGSIADQNKMGIASYFPKTVASGPGAPKWSEPTVVAAGPARTVVETHCEGYQVKKDDTVTLEGNITNYVSIWTDAPTVDFEQIVDYQGTVYDHTWSYSDGLDLGAEMDPNDRLIVPLLDQAYLVKFPLREDIQHSPYQPLYNTWVPDEGWYAFQDTAEKRGMGTFYMTLTEIIERDTWVAYRPAWNPVLALRTTPGLPQVGLNFMDRALRSRNEWRRGLR
ncbi:MAG: hypothetical protein GX100_00580 [candidate division WS1 bacterium]|nr:hypothetical protein [candidate division WS1 bacterium]